MSSDLTAPAPDPDHDEFTSLPHGERWFVDGFAAIPVAGGVVGQLCDMTQAQATIQALRAQGIRATYTHLIVRAAALALRRYPEGHQMVCGYTRVRPGRIDIGLSIAGQTNFAPVLIIEGADKLPLPALIAHLQAAVPAAREKEVRDLAGMRRTGWIIPFGFMRRWILRWLGTQFWFRRKLVGTFQVSCVPACDFAMPMLFYSGCLLSAGSITERVLPIGGRPEVRLSAWLTIPLDHRSMDGRVASNLIQAVRRVLESPELLAEAGVTAESVGAEPPSPFPAPDQVLPAPLPSATAVTDSPARA